MAQFRAFSEAAARERRQLRLLHAQDMRAAQYDEKSWKPYVKQLEKNV